MHNHNIYSTCNHLKAEMLRWGRGRWTQIDLKKAKEHFDTFNQKDTKQKGFYFEKLAKIMIESKMSYCRFVNHGGRENSKR